jgi:hypothetical protein
LLSCAPLFCTLTSPFPRLVPSFQVVTAHYNERSAQIQSLRKLFFGNYPWTLATDVLKPKKKTPLGLDNNDVAPERPPMALTPVLLDDGLSTIGSLRQALRAKEFHCHQNLYNCFCSGVEAGILRGSADHEPGSRLDEILSVGAETHLRCELWHTLSEYGFGHHISNDSRNDRISLFREIASAVRAGRDEHGDDAHATRKADMNREDDDEDGDEDESDEEPTAGIAMDSEMW